MQPQTPVAPQQVLPPHKSKKNLFITLAIVLLVIASLFISFIIGTKPKTSVIINPDQAVAKDTTAHDILSKLDSSAALVDDPTYIVFSDLNGPITTLTITQQATEAIHKSAIKDERSSSLVKMDAKDTDKAKALYAKLLQTLSDASYTAGKSLAAKQVLYPPTFDATEQFDTFTNTTKTCVTQMTLIVTPEDTGYDKNSVYLACFNTDSYKVAADIIHTAQAAAPDQLTGVSSVKDVTLSDNTTGTIVSAASPGAPYSMAIINDKWIAVGGSQSADCSLFDAPVLKGAFKGMTCYDTALGDDRVIQ
jgi:hypothetical protein